MLALIISFYCYLVYWYCIAYLLDDLLVEISFYLDLKEAVHIHVGPGERTQWLREGLLLLQRTGAWFPVPT